MNLVTIDRWLAAFWIDVLSHLWQTALVLIPLFALTHVLRSAPARWTHRLWVAALIKLFVPLAALGPLVGAGLRRLFAVSPATPGESAYAGFLAWVTVIGADPAAGASLATGWFPAPFWTLGTAVYLVIAARLLARTGRDIFAARRLAKLDAAIPEASAARLERALEISGVARDGVRVSDSDILPSVVGAIRARIVLPARLLDALDVDELAAVVLHEEMHRRNGDTIVSLVQRIAADLLFFFPLLGPMQRRLREAAEMRCDDEAIRAGAAPKSYVRALARTIRLGLAPSPAPAALGDGNPSIVAKRLARLLEPRRTPIMPKHRLAAFAAVAVLAAGILLPVPPARVLAGAPPSVPNLGLMSSTNRVVSLQLVDAPAAVALREIAAAGGFDLAFEGAEDCCRVSLSLNQVPVRQALEAVAAQTDLRYEVVNFKNLRVTLPPPVLPTPDMTLPPPVLPTPDMTLPKLVTKVEPVYPKEARLARVEGRVSLQAVIREDGTVGEIQVLRNSSGMDSIAESSVAALKQWKYEPAMKQGRPVRIYYTVVMSFTLR